MQQGRGDLAKLDDRKSLDLRSEGTVARAAAAGRDPTVLELFDAQVARSPEAPAVLFPGGQLSYRELDRRALGLACRLRALGVGRDRVVGISVERSSEMLIAVLAVLKAGGAYVALDPAYPEQRLSLILGDTRPQVLIAESSRRRRFSQYRGPVVALGGDDGWTIDGVAEAPPPGPAGDWLAYVVYTSGSTGTPKGVAVEHRPLANLISWQLRASRIGPGQRTLQFTSLAFDVSFQEIFATWCAGGALVLVDERTRRDPDALYQLIDDRRIARLFLPYVALQGLAVAAAARNAAPPSLIEVIVAGEALRITSQIAWFFARLPGCALVNQYGPAEAAVIVTAFPLAGDPYRWPALPPIGKPIDRVRTLILDENRNPVPEGAAGEIHIGGIALARGYLSSPELTAEKFVVEGAGAGRLYRTGDLGRRRADGNIEFLGRRDRQVKVRGYRIEPGEIEVALAQHPQVGQAVVKLYEPAPGDKRLVAYVVARAGGPPPVAELMRFLGERLPRYMVPSLIAFIDAVPVTPSGKIDFSGLPEPEAWQGPQAAPAPPRHETERRLAAIWSRVLKVGSLGVTDDFFAIGGDSILALRLALEIERAFARTVPLGVIFSAPTIEHLARILDRGEVPATGFSLVPVRTAGIAPPIFFVHFIPRALVRRLVTDRPVYGLAYGLAAQTAHRAADLPPRVEDLAAQYVEEMRQVQPRGPYALVGYSGGGLVAWEMAQQLRAEGETVGFLGLIDTFDLSRHGDLRRIPRLPLYRQMANFLRLPPVEIWLALNTKYRQWADKAAAALEKREDRLWTAYRPERYAGDLTLFTASLPWSIRRDLPSMAAEWRRLIDGRVEIHEVPGRHRTLVVAPNVRVLAAKLGACLGPDRERRAAHRNRDPAAAIVS
jgi:amino acid adenylation domain-containing protein